MPAGAAPALRRLRGPKSLGVRLVLILTAVGLAGSLAITALLLGIITPSFDRLESAATAATVDRAQAAIDGFAARAEAAARAGAGRAGAGGVSSRSFYRQVGGRVYAVGIAHARGMAPVVIVRELGAARLAGVLRLPARIDASAAAPEVQVVRHRARLAVSIPIRGPDGRPVAEARFDVPRDLSMLGLRTVFFAVAGVILLLAVMLAVLRRAIARLVLAPLRRVERHMGDVSRSGAPDPLPDAGRSDEIGSLVTSFNAMLRQLGELRERVEVQSFELGRRESVVAVMHNIRNALAPITTILSQPIGRPPADAALVDRAIGELATADIPAARRQTLVAFVAAASDGDRAAREDHARALESGRAALGNVLDIIGGGHDRAHERPELSPCDLTAIVAQNAAIGRYAGGASIAFIFPSMPHWVLGNRLILGQVVGNLLANAGEAIVARGGEGGAITVTITEGDAHVEMTVRDNGEGFDPGIAPDLFQRGHSTRGHRWGGLGLHWCANAMLGMGGTLRLDSEGPGLGAQAVLTLRRPPAVGPCATIAA